MWGRRGQLWGSAERGRPRGPASPVPRVTRVPSPCHACRSSRVSAPGRVTRASRVVRVALPASRVLPLSRVSRASRVARGMRVRPASRVRCVCRITCSSSHTCHVLLSPHASLVSHMAYSYMCLVTRVLCVTSFCHSYPMFLLSHVSRVTPSFSCHVCHLHDACARAFPCPVCSRFLPRHVCQLRVSSRVSRSQLHHVTRVLPVSYVCLDLRCITCSCVTRVPCVCCIVSCVSLQCDTSFNHAGRVFLMYYACLCVSHVFFLHGVSFSRAADFYTCFHVFFLCYVLRVSCHMFLVSVTPVLAVSPMSVPCHVSSCHTSPSCHTCSLFFPCHACPVSRVSRVMRVPCHACPACPLCHACPLPCHVFVPCHTCSFPHDTCPSSLTSRVSPRGHVTHVCVLPVTCDAPSVKGRGL